MNRVGCSRRDKRKRLQEVDKIRGQKKTVKLTLIRG